MWTSSDGVRYGRDQAPAVAEWPIPAAARLRRRKSRVCDERSLAELTYHAAYEPQRGIRHRPASTYAALTITPTVLANCDDSPSKAAYLVRG
jgi:hypothetical protein